MSGRTHRFSRRWATTVTPIPSLTTDQAEATWHQLANHWVSPHHDLGLRSRCLTGRAGRSDYGLRFFFGMAQA